MPEQRKKQPAKCRNCETEFMAAVREVKRGNGKFCSRKCQRSFQARTNAANKKSSIPISEQRKIWRAKVTIDVRKAHSKTNWAIRSGKITKEPCMIREASAVMLKFLECVSLDTDCMGPSCYYCDGDELHPPTHRAKQAQDILSAIRKRDEG